MHFKPQFGTAYLTQYFLDPPNLTTFQTNLDTMGV